METTATTSPYSGDRMRLARVAVAAQMLAFGTQLGIWFAHLPVVVARLDLEPGPLSIGLLSIGVIGLLMQPFAGLATARFGARRTAMVLLPLVPIAATILINAPSQPMFFIGCILIGLVGSPSNVATNVLAAEWERFHGRPVMSSFHGFFSLGGLVGSLLGGAIIGAGLGDGRGAALAGVLLILLALWATINALNTPPAPAQPRTGPRFALPAAALLSICAIAFCCNLIEGSIGDWSGLYLNTIKGADAAFAAGGYAMFSVAMAALRFAGGPIVERLGKKTLIAGGGVVMALGLLIVVLSPWAIGSAIGFLVVAVGAANISPVLTSTAANTPGVPSGIGVAALASAMTLGFLAGPPIIGFIAQLWGLGWGLAFVALLGVLVAGGATGRRWDPAPAAAK
jgi:MFS family permease